MASEGPQVFQTRQKRNICDILTSELELVKNKLDHIIKMVPFKYYDNKKKAKGGAENVPLFIIGECLRRGISINIELNTLFVSRVPYTSRVKMFFFTQPAIVSNYKKKK